MRLSYLKSYFHGHFAWLSAFFLVIYLWKLSGAGWLPGISDHLSNFALTGLLSLLIIGPWAFESKRGTFRTLTVVIVFILANLAVEIVAGGTLGGFNVLDGVDAFYGVLAAGIVMGVHSLLVARNGRA